MWSALLDPSMFLLHNSSLLLAVSSFLACMDCMCMREIVVPLSAFVTFSGETQKKRVGAPNEAMPRGLRVVRSCH